MNIKLIILIIAYITIQIYSNEIKEKGEFYILWPSEVISTSFHSNFYLELYFLTRATLSRHASILNAMAIYRRKLENQKLYPRVYDIEIQNSISPL